MSHKTEKSENVYHIVRNIAQLSGQKTNLVTLDGMRVI